MISGSPAKITTTLQRLLAALLCFTEHTLKIIENEALLRYVKICLYRTRSRLRLCGVREGMAEIKQTKVVHTERDRGTRH